jgi:hypothetical protein
MESSLHAAREEIDNLHQDWDAARQDAADAHSENHKLRALNAELVAALESLCGERIPSREDFEAARAAIAKAKPE